MSRQNSIRVSSNTWCCLRGLFLPSLWDENTFLNSHILGVLVLCVRGPGSLSPGQEECGPASRSSQLQRLEGLKNAPPTPGLSEAGFKQRNGGRQLPERPFRDCELRVRLALTPHPGLRALESPRGSPRLPSLLAPTQSAGLGTQPVPSSTVLRVAERGWHGRFSFQVPGERHGISRDGSPALG